MNDVATDLLDLPLSILRLSTRPYHALTVNEQLSTVGQLVGYTDQELLRIPNFGRVSVQEVRDRLAEHGLALKHPPEMPPAPVHFPTLYERLGHIEAMLQTLIDRLA